MADGCLEVFRRALLGRGFFAHVAPLRSRPGMASVIWESLVIMRRCSREEFANNRSAPYLFIYIDIIQFVCLFVCSFAIRAKTIAQNATKLSGIIKLGSVSVLHGLKLPVLQFLKRYPPISGFLFAAGGHFINYRSIDFRLSDGLIRCRSTIDFKLGRRYSSYLPLLPADIRQNWLGPTRCCATRHSRSPPKAGALLVYIDFCHFANGGAHVVPYKALNPL